MPSIRSVRSPAGLSLAVTLVVALVGALHLALDAWAPPAGASAAQPPPRAQAATQQAEPDDADADEDDDAWDVTQARGATREIDFTTDEGTWMSVDVSPDGEWIVFDLLAHVYRVPAAGGEAECLTQDSGVAVNFHPRYSPDGSTIAFVSDRGGQNNLWLMDADGGNPRSVFTDPSVRVYEPAWTPDGNYIVVRRQFIGRPSTSGIWMYHREGGDGVELVGNDVSRAQWPAVSPDGAFVYFQYNAGNLQPVNRRDAVGGSSQIQRVALADGELSEVTSGVGRQQYRSANGGAAAPEISPDGRWMAFARRVPDGTISYKGHRFGPRTALWLRDLHTGAERLVMDPIEVDMLEGMKTWRTLPGYDWSADSRSIVISQGGKIRRLDVGSGEVETIPFTARVHRTISEQTRASFRITDEPFDVRFVRWTTASPDGSTLAFQAVGKIYVMSLPGGAPRRLTPDAFEPFEFAPAWSPDGRWIAFTSWDDAERGRVWRVPASGGAPQPLVDEPGEYLQPVWAPDGSSLVVARGGGQTARGRTLADNFWYELVRIPAAGGDAESIVRVSNRGGSGRRQIVRASFGLDGRIFYPETIENEDGDPSTLTALRSVAADGSDERTHLTFPYADEVVVSPDGLWVAFQEGDNVYLTVLPPQGAGKEPVRIDKPDGKLPVRQLSTEGGLFPGWRDDRTVEFGSGATYTAYDVRTEESTTTSIALRVPRRIPDGSVAFRDARILTMRDREVLDPATVVIARGRITCVGQCGTDGVDQVIDAQGKTIIPGIVDMHAHHYRQYAGVIPARPYETAIYLAYGVTTDLDNSMWSTNVFSTAELQAAGAVIGPRAFSTGDPLYRGDGRRQNELTSYEVAEQNIMRLKSWGAVSIKQYLQPRRDQRQWVSDIARRENLAVTSEGDSLEFNLGMIMDGQTAWEHPMSYMPVYGDAARFFGTAGAVYSPTFIVGGPGPWNEEYFWQESQVWKDAKQRRFLPWAQLVPHTRRYVQRPVSDYSFPMIAQALADIIEHGGSGAIGSHGQQHGLGSHWEIWMAEAALGPMGALEVATIQGAEFLGAERDIGSIEVGKLGDLVVLDANPLDDIRNTTDIQYVVQAGVVYEGETLDEVWPEARPFGDYYWVDPDAYREDDRPVQWWDEPR